jgi:diaminopimelate decarboxylase
MEPGRSISANAGVLLTKVDLKPTNHRNFAIIDAAMNDLIRPSLYEAWMDIQSVDPIQMLKKKLGMWLVRSVKQVISRQRA